MTRYEQGFMNKCAEYGVSSDSAMLLMRKMAAKAALPFVPRKGLLTSLRDIVSKNPVYRLYEGVPINDLPTQIQHGIGSFESKRLSPEAIRAMFAREGFRPTKNDIRLMQSLFENNLTPLERKSRLLERTSILDPSLKNRTVLRYMKGAVSPYSPIRYGGTGRVKGYPAWKSMMRWELDNNLREFHYQQMMGQIPKNVKFEDFIRRMA